MATIPAVITTTSKQFSLKLSDFWKAFIVAVITPVLTIITNSLQAGTLTFNWKAIAITALIAGIAYLTKNFFTSAKIQVNNPTPATIAAVDAGNAEIRVIDTKGKTTTAP